MREIGIDISGHWSKHLEEFLGRQRVAPSSPSVGTPIRIVLCSQGEVNRYHWGFDDPAKAGGTDDDQLAVFRRVRDEIQRVFEAYAAGRRDQGKAVEAAQLKSASKASTRKAARGLSLST